MILQAQDYQISKVPSIDLMQLLPTFSSLKKNAKSSASHGEGVTSSFAIGKYSDWPKFSTE